MKKNSIFALALSVLLVLVLFSCTLYVSYFSDHDCCGEDCPICENIVVCVKTIESFGLCLLVGSVSASLFLLAVSLKESTYFCTLSFGSLVSNKVRINS